MPASAIEKGVKNVEYYRDVKPILDRSCVACHTQKQRTAGRATWFSTTTRRSIFPMPTTFPALIIGWRWTTPAASAGRRLIGSWRNANASRYVRMFQSRRSLLIWKVFGRRTDGWTNDDFPTETVAGDPHTLRQRGKPVPNTRGEPQSSRSRLHRQHHAAAGGRRG